MEFALALITISAAAGLSIFVSRSPAFITNCKWIIAFICIKISRWRNKRRFDLYEIMAKNQPYKVGFLPPKLEYELESPQPENHLLQAADEVFFYGVNADSECLITRIAKSVGDKAQAWLHLKLKNGRIYSLERTSGYQHGCSDRAREFTCGGLRIHYMKPMRRWRIFYHGLLRESSEQDPSVDRMVYVKIALIWKAGSDCFDMTTDIDSKALASGFARSKWKSFAPPLKKLMEAMNIYCQGGNIMGTVHVDGESEDHILYLFGERTRYIGATNLGKGSKFLHILGRITKTGGMVHVGEATIPGVVENLKFGFMVMPCGRLASITDGDMLIEDVSRGQNESIKAVFHSEGLQFEIDGSVVGKVCNLESNTEWDHFSARELNIHMNSLHGMGVLIKGEILTSAKRTMLQYDTKELPKVIPAAIHFSEELCQVSEVTGGKGSSLGKLTQLSKQLQNFIVPNGIVVTTSAFQAFVNQDVLREIKCLEDVLYGKTSGDIKEACRRVMDEVIKSNIPENVHQEIVKSLEKAFGEALHSKKFAVRSSATGEDTEQLSAAGQMETILGVTGLNQIMAALKKCWASQFGFIAVQYKRRYGQVINSPMAVVIQEMVNCDVAGVLFTCDPLTGNPSLMSITANYGLGESVVSASEEPDAITLVRDCEDNLKVKDKIIGRKGHRIVVKDGEGTSVEEVSDAEKESCCMSDDMIIRLANVALEIEKKYRSNRDIEWGFWKNNLYIFQSRPVTSGTGETDFEIDHETDGPTRIEKDFLTICNVGEVMPGATSPMGLDYYMKYFHLMFQGPSVIEWQSKVRCNYYYKFLVHFYNHVMFYTVELLERINEGRSFVDGTMVSFFGRVIEDEDLFETARIRYDRDKKDSLFEKYYRRLRCIFTARSRLERTEKAYSNYHVPVEKAKNSYELFDILMHMGPDMYEPATTHLMASQAATIWNMFLISILQKAKGGISPEVMSDFSKLLSSINEVESAEIPIAMQSLAHHIGKEIGPEKFKKMDNDEIIEWLNSSSSESGVQYRQFLKKHGHRCLREFDVRAVTWGMDPKLVIKLLKNFVGNVSLDKSPKKSADTEKLIASYENSLDFFNRLMLKFLIPICRRGVQTREKTKSLLIRVNHEMRKGYRHLAKMMVAEGRIPDEDLMYFMLLEEIKELISNRSPQIISKAFHRRKRFPVLDSYIFPEYIKGYPTPVNLDTSVLPPIGDNFSMKGTPVSQGIAKGFVRVALTMDEAAHLKPGEILVTHSTDIGWSPYFPILAGVVTEIGGLISHGAVVSREYGLPCIAGLEAATRQLLTGDYVILDGTTGILQKLPAPE